MNAMADRLRMQAEVLRGIAEALDHDANRLEEVDDGKKRLQTSVRT